MLVIMGLGFVFEDNLRLIYGYGNLWFEVKG
jgi:hypothetical protein